MERILTGIQNTGIPHLGNILGAMRPAIQLAKQYPQQQALFFIADLHALTTTKDVNIQRDNAYATAAAWLACGVNPEESIFYRQSRIPAVCELAWYLSCFTPYPMLANAHAFKRKAKRLSEVSTGLFTYPVLMTADILLYQAQIVPVGMDQRQHLEIARDLALRFNQRYGPTFVIPQAKINSSVPIIPGTDGEKMSKSYGNTIDIFLADKQLRKQVMSIVTDSTPLEAPKNPDTCHVFALYKLLADDDQITQMRNNYLGGNYGYGHAKQALFEVIVNKYEKQRIEFNNLMSNPTRINERLAAGEIRAREIAREVLAKVKVKLGF